mmetsp:Transcript_49505/g.146233  ORF Transcript_49505/g.146233 Transcript_49505/m.146233 type:complete len:254 (-) Transcript_49505:21-782(-)
MLPDLSEERLDVDGLLAPAQRRHDAHRRIRDLALEDGRQVPPHAIDLNVRPLCEELFQLSLGTGRLVRDGAERHPRLRLCLPQGRGQEQLPHALCIGVRLLDDQLSRNLGEDIALAELRRRLLAGCGVGRRSLGRACGGLLRELHAPHEEGVGVLEELDAVRLGLAAEAHEAFRPALSLEEDLASGLECLELVCGQLQEAEARLWSLLLQVLDVRVRADEVSGEPRIHRLALREHHPGGLAAGREGRARSPPR